MLGFDYGAPTRIIFGKNTQHQIGALAAQYGYQKLLVHYGGGSAVRSGLLADVRASLTQAGIAYVELGGVQPNPRDDLVREGAALCRREGVNAVLAVGGGSVIDSAKAIALAAPDDGDFWDFFERVRMPEKHLPVCTIVTLASSGSEASNSSVITHGGKGVKMGLGIPENYPVFSILNPELTYSLPAYQTACGCADIMAHALERYFSHTPQVGLSDRLLEAVMQTVLQYGPIAISRPEHYGARANLMWAGSLAHNGLFGMGREGDWGSHKLEHILSARYDVAHGAGMAVIFPAWMRVQYKHNIPLFSQLFERLFGIRPDRDDPCQSILRGIGMLKDFYRSLGLPVSLGQLGVPKEDIPWLVKHVQRDPQGRVGVFHPLDDEGIRAVYEQALEM